MPRRKIVQYTLIGRPILDSEIFNALKRGLIRCSRCKNWIENLTEEEALNDMDGHGWTNKETAHAFICFHCANLDPKGFDYETYFAGRVKIHNGEIHVLHGAGIYTIRQWGEVGYAKMLPEIFNNKEARHSSQA